ncbi:hypothetical protein V8C40DRAFT_247846 [Trichoderma camerunense]
MYEILIQNATQVFRALFQYTQEEGVGVSIDTIQSPPPSPPPPFHVFSLKEKMSLAETQVIAIDYGSKEKLQEILKEKLGEENFKLVQRISNQWKIKLAKRLTEAEIDEIRTSMKIHYLPTS